MKKAECRFSPIKRPDKNRLARSPISGIRRRITLPQVFRLRPPEGPTMTHLMTSRRKEFFKNPQTSAPKNKLAIFFFAIGGSMISSSSPASVELSGSAAYYKQQFDQNSGAYALSRRWTTGLA